MIGKEVGHYRILDRLGSGGMGVVYKAEDTRLGRVVALKFLGAELLTNESLRRRFLHEARAASAIDHPNVCHVYEVGEADDGRYFMAMSYCEGRSLRDVIQDGPTAPREAFSIAFGIAQGLWAAHRRKIVHRDIKPANVILTDDGFVRIVDFGLALLIGESSVTSSAVTVGTVAYMSPEQTAGSRVGPNTDIWSLGVTLYELLTGKFPFRGDVNAALVYSIVHEPYDTLPGAIPLPVARVVGRCLQKDPAKRYQTAEELLEDMVKAAQELGWESSVASATVAPILRERRRRIRTRRLLIVGAALVVTAAGARGVYQWNHRLFTTRTRVAVLPFKNQLGPDQDAFVAGLGDYVARVLDIASGEKKSLWNVPYSTVTRAQLAAPRDAATSFGVNRVMIGDVQRYGGHSILNLEYCSASNLHVVSRESIEFDMSSPGKLLDNVATAIYHIAGIRGATPAAFHTENASAVRSYLAGLGYLTPSRAPRAIPDSTQNRLALAVLESCVHADDRFAPGMCALGFAALRQYAQTNDARMLERARHWSARATRVTPSFPDAMLLRAEIARRANQPDSAIAAYGELLSVSPGNYAGTFWRANLLISQSRIAEAESTYLDMVSARPDLWLAPRSLGSFYYAQNRIDDAQVAWQRSIRLAPRDATTLNNLGAVHYRNNEWADARKMFQQAFHISPDCESCNNVATALYFDRKYQEAVHYFEYAIQYCDTNDCTTWGNLASALYWTKDGPDKARPVYAHAVRKARASAVERPGDAKFVGYLIDYYVMSGDTSSTRSMIASCDNTAMQDERVLYSIGSAYEKLGNRDLALRYLGLAVRHGFPLSVIELAPVLDELRRDPMYDEVVRKAAAAPGATAASRTK